MKATTLLGAIMLWMVMLFGLIVTFGTNQSYGQISRVQSISGSVGNGTSIAATLSAAPNNGNTMVAVISTRGTAASQVSSITQTGATWVRASQSAGTSGSTTEVWYASNVSSATTGVTITLASSLRAAAVIMEYSGILGVSPVDKIANNSGSGTSASTGTTTATAQANELVIGGIGLVSSNYTLSSITSSFTTIASISSTGGSSSSNTLLYALEKIVSVTGTQSTGGTISTSSVWSGAIATFRAKAASATSLTTSAATTTYGTAPTFTATVTPSAVTGTVEFFEGANSLGTATLTGTTTKTATFTPSATQLPAGTLSITAVYNSNASYESSTSSAVTQTVNKRVVTLSGTRPYDGTVIAGSSTLSISNNLDGANLTLSGSAIASSKDVGARTLTVPAAPARIQFASGSTGANTATSFTVTLGSAPQNGNTLVAIISTRNTNANTVSSISQSGVSGWTRAAQSTNTSGNTTEIWYAPASSVSGASVTITLAQSNVRTAATVIEYDGILSVNPLDANNSNFGSSTSAGTGSVSTTVANELLIGGIGYNNTSYSLGSISGGFTNVTTTSTTNGTTSNNTELYTLERFVTATGTYSAGGTISTSSVWSAAIVSFKAELSSGSILTLAGSAANNYTLTGTTGTYNITTQSLSITANDTSKCKGSTFAFLSTDFSTSGLVGGETVGSVTLTSTGSASSALAGTYAIVPSAATGGTFTASNYSIGYVNGTLTVDSLSAPTAGNNSRCGSGTVAISATGSAEETIDWYAAASGGTVLTGGTGVTSFTTPSISTTTTYYAQSRNTTTGCVSSIRTAVTATVNAAPSAPTGTNAARCGTGTVSLSASGTGTIKWYNASTGGTLLGSGNSYTTSSISATTTYYAMDSIVATGCTSTRTAVTATINTVPSAPSGTNGARCGTGTVSLSASGTGTIKWYDASTGGTLLSSGSSYTTPSISSTTIYYALDSNATTGCVSTSRTAVTATVNAVPSAPTGTDGARCGTGTVSLSATGTGTIKWYNASTGGTLLGSGSSYTTPSISATTIYYAMDSIASTGCVSATRDIVTATVNAVPSAPTGTSASRCGTGTVSLSASGTGTIKWYNASTGGTLLSSGNSYTTPSISATTIYYALDSNATTGCTSTRTAVTATVNTVPSAPSGTNGARCGAGTVNLSASGTGIIKWYDASTGGTLLSSGSSYTTPSISATTIYYALDSNATTGCVSATRTAVTATVNAVPSAPTGTDGARCGTGTVSLSATGTGTIKWYNASTGGTLLGSGSSYTTPSISATTIYYAMDSIASTGCVSATRDIVTATVNAVPSAPTGTSASRCGTGTVSLSASGTGTIKWYNASTGGTLLSSGNSYTTPSISTTTTYYALDSVASPGCTSTRTAVTATVNTVPSAPSGTNGARCGTGTVSLSASGTGTIKWYDASTGGTLLSSGNSYTTPSISATTIYYALDSNASTGCVSATRTAVTATVNINVGITSATAAASPICSSATTTLTANGVVGTNAVVTWWTGTGGTGTNLGTGTTLTNRGPGTYFARVTGDCGTAVEASVTVSSKTNVGITSATAATSSICSSATTTLTANGVVGTNAVVTWWTGTGGTGTNLGTGLTITRGPGTYYARLTGDCGTAVEASVTVSSLVNAGITSATAASSSVCSNATTTLTANGVVGTNAVVTWWTGTGGTGTNLGTGATLTNRGPGTYFASVTADCGSAVEASVTVGSLAIPTSVTATASSNNLCGAGTVNLTGIASGASAGTIAFQGFEASGSTVTYAVTGGSTKTGTSGSSASGDRPASTSFVNSGTVSYWINNGTATITTANITGLQGYSAKTVSMKLASFAIGSSGAGADATDVVTVAISLDGGTTYSNELTVNGGTTGNAYWSFTSGTGTANVAYDGLNNPTAFAPTGGSARTSDGYSTLNVTIPDTASQVRIRVTMLNNNANEAWVLDDISLTGTQMAYSWTSDPAGFTSGFKNPQNISVSDTTIFTLTATNAAGCSATDTAIVRVNTISAPDGTDGARCGTGTVSLSASGIGTIKWYNASTGGTLLSTGNSYTTPSISATTTYYALDSIASTGCTSTRTAVTATVNTVPSAPSGTNGARCGTGTVSLSASGTGTIKWYDASTGGTLLSSGSSYTTPSISTTTIYYALDSNATTGCVSATRTAVTATVNAVPSAPTGTDGARCGTGTVSLSASGTGTIKWYNASTGGTLLGSGSSYTTPSISATTIYYAMDSIASTGCVSATRDIVTATVNAVPSAPTGTGAARCGTGTVSLSATGTGTIKWYNASTGGTLLSTGNSYTTPSISATTIYYALDSNATTGCTSTRTAVTATVNAVPSAPSGTNGARCGTGTVSLSASGTGTIKWYDASTGGTLLSSGNSYTTPSISATTIYYALDSNATTGCVSATRTAVTATVNAVPSAPTGTDGARCGTGTVSLSATGTGTIKWYNASTGGTLLGSGSSYTTPSISATTIYYAMDSIASTGCVSATRDIVTATVNAVPSAPTGTGAARCGTGTVSLSATGTGTIKWYNASTGGTLLSTGNSYTTPSISTTTTYYALDSVASPGCTSTRTAVTATVNTVPSAPSGTNGARCGTGTVSLSASGTGTIKWYDASTGGTLLSTGNSYTTPSISATTIYYALDSISSTGCVSTTRRAVTATVNAVPSAPTGTDGARCGTGTVSLSASGTGTIKWYNASTGGTLLSSANSYTTPSISATTIYYVMDSIVATGCVSATRTAVTATVNAVPSAPTGTDGARCGTGTVSLSASGTGTIKWYNASTGGTLLSTGNSYTTPSISTTTTYYAMDSVASPGCTSTRTAVTATINTVPSAPTGTNGSSCGAGTVNLSASGSGTIKWYDASTGGTLLSSGNSFTTSSISSTTIYYALDSNASTGCVSATRTAVTATVLAKPTLVLGTPSSSNICDGASQILNASATISSTAVDTVDFNDFVSTSYTTTGSATNGGNKFAIQSSPYNPNSGTYIITNNVDGSTFMVATAANLFQSTTTTSQLISTVYNTQGYTDLNLVFNHSYVINSGSGNSKVEVSTDGGTNWTAVKTYTTNQGANNNFVKDSIALNAYINQSNLRIRFNANISASSAVSWWAIDKVILKGSFPMTPLFSWSANTATGVNGLTANAQTYLAANSTTTVSPTDTTLYTLTAKDPLTGCTTSATPITVNVLSKPSAPIGTGASRCSTGRVILTATVGVDETVDWYTVASGGTATATGTDVWQTPSLTTTTTYYIATRNTTTGCVSATRTPVVATINNVDTTNVTVTNCVSYLWNGTTYTNSGTFTYHTTNSAGCDSIAILNLTITVPTESSVDITNCDSYTWNGTTYITSGTYTFTTTNSVGCDSVATLNLTINRSTSFTENITNCDTYTWNGTTYSNSGTYSFSTTNSVGCDSTAILNLTINRSTTSSPVSIIVCDAFTWNGNSYSATGVYTYSTTNSAGCDSTATLNLTVKNSTTSTTVIEACDAYRWNNATYSASGIFTYTTTNSIGCDSVASLDLTIKYSTSYEFSASNCDNYVWNGVTYTASGTYSFTTTNAVGCDSVATLNLTILESSTSATTESACEQYQWNGVTYSNSGIYTYVSTNASGCTSTDTLHLTIKRGTTSTSTAISCETYDWNGSVYSNTGTFTYNTTNSVGCDSVALLNLTILNGTNETIYAESCVNYFINDSLYTESGTYTQRLVNSVGCDSILTIILTINQGTFTANTVTACDSYLWNNILYTQSGQFIVYYNNAQGCLSADTLYLTIKNSTTSSTTISACDSYIWNGEEYTTSGVYTYVTTNAVNCDSTATLNLTIETAPSLNPINGLTDVCKYTTTTYTSNVLGGIWSSDDTTKLRIDSITGVATSIESGVANITYLVTTSLGCTNSVSLAVTVLESELITISGSNNVCYGSSITLASNEEDGVWSTDNSNIASIGSSSGIVQGVTVGNAVVTYTYTESSTGCVSTDTFNITVNELPSAPDTIYGLQELCQFVNTSDTIEYSVPLVSGITAYNWIVPTGATIVSGQNTSTIRVLFDDQLARAGAKIYVNAVSEAGCSSGSTFLRIYKSIPYLFTLNGTNNACPLVGLDTVAYYTTNISSTANYYDWVVPSGATIVSGQGTYQIGVKYDTSFRSGYVRVRGLSNCGVMSGTGKSLAIVRYMPNEPGFINGPSNTCAYYNNGTEVTYSVADVAFATSYVWTIPNNVTLLSGQGTNTIVVRFEAGFVNSTLKVRALSNCSASLDRGLYLTANAYTMPSYLSGPTNACMYVNTGNMATYVCAKSTGAPAYIWTVPAGVTIIERPGDLPENDTIIRVLFDENFVTATKIEVQTTGCNTSLARAIAISKTSPSAPSSVTGITNVCNYIGTNSPVRYSTRRVLHATQYLWTVPNDAQIQSYDGDTAINVIFHSGFTTGMIEARTSNACAVSSSRTLSVSRALPTIPSSISGPTNSCAYYANGTTATYSIPAVQDATGYTWTLPSYMTLVSGQNTTSITVKFDSGFVTSSIKVKSLNACAESLEKTLRVTATPYATPGTITGPTNSCIYINDGIATYTIRKVANATGYLWTVPTGATIIDHPAGIGASDTIIKVTYTPDFLFGSSIRVQSMGCGLSSAKTLAITGSVSTQPGSITGTSNVCEFMQSSTNPNGIIATYRIRKVSSANAYAWSVPDEAEIVGHPGGLGVNDTAIMVKFEDVFIGGSIKVRSSNSCGSSSERSYTVTRTQPSSPGSISTTALGICPNRSYRYSISSMPTNATSVVWTLPTGATIVSQTSLSITVSYPSGAITGTVKAQSFNNCSSSDFRTLSVRYTACPNSIIGTTPVVTGRVEEQVEVVKPLSLGVSVYPNPTTSSFRVKIKAVSTEKLHIKLMDMAGRMLKIYQVMPGEDLNFGNELRAGVYMIEVTQGNLKSVQRLMKF